MLHPFKLLLAAATVVGFAAGPAAAQSDGAKPKAAGTRPDAASESKTSQASADDFEQNRRLHMQKSKENNTSKPDN